MKDFQSYRQKKNNEYAEQKPMRLELRNGKETYRDWKRSSGWLESWEGLLLVTDVSTTCAEAIFRVKW